MQTANHEGLMLFERKSSASCRCCPLRWRGDVDFRNPSVLHTLELTDGRSAPEAVSTRWDTVVIEEVRLALKIDGASMNRE